MNFGAPEWFFLLPLLAVIGWRWRGLRLHEPLRAAALLTCLRSIETACAAASAVMAHAQSAATVNNILRKGLSPLG